MPNGADIIIVGWIVIFACMAYALMHQSPMDPSYRDLTEEEDDD